MDIPRMFYGRMGEVSTRATKLQKEFLRGKPLHELDFGPMMSTSEEPTARIVLRRLRGDSGGAQFHPYYFSQKVLAAFARGKVSLAQREAVFVWSLEVPWRFLGIVQQEALFYVSWGNEKPHLRRAFLEAASRFWDVLEGEGARYGFPTPLWASPFSMTPTAIVPALDKEGFPMTPNPVETPGRVYELLCAAMQKFKSEAPWPPS